jgi:nucleotide-binding universal stress UspA family protein
VPHLVGALSEGLAPLIDANGFDKMERARPVIAAAKRIAGRARKLPVHVLEGRAVDLVPALARRTHADLIVLGTHGRTGVRRALLGSVAEGITRGSPVPTLLVRAPAAPA